MARKEIIKYYVAEFYPYNPDVGCSYNSCIWQVKEKNSTKIDRRCIIGFRFFDEKCFVLPDGKIYKR